MVNEQRVLSLSFLMEFSKKLYFVESYLLQSYVFLSGMKRHLTSFFNLVTMMISEIQEMNPF